MPEQTASSPAPLTAETMCPALKELPTQASFQNSTLDVFHPVPVHIVGIQLWIY